MFQKNLFQNEELIYVAYDIGTYINTINIIEYNNIIHSSNVLYWWNGNGNITVCSKFKVSTLQTSVIISKVKVNA